MVIDKIERAKGGYLIHEGELVRFIKSGIVMSATDSQPTWSEEFITYLIERVLTLEEDM